MSQACSQCGAAVDLHRLECPSCGALYLATLKPPVFHEAVTGPPLAPREPAPPHPPTSSPPPADGGPPGPGQGPVRPAPRVRPSVPGPLAAEGRTEGHPPTPFGTLKPPSFYSPGPELGSAAPQAAEGTPRTAARVKPKAPKEPKGPAPALPWAPAADPALMPGVARRAAPAPPPAPVEQRPEPDVLAPPIMATVGIQGFDIKSLNVAKRNYHIELPDAQGNWVKLSSIVGFSKTPAFGRSSDPRHEAMRTVALKHLRFENTSQGLYVRPYATLNGVYRRVKAPVELVSGTWLRVGNYVFLFRVTESQDPVPARVVEGEHQVARDLSSRGELVFLRPNGGVGLRFPLLKAGATVIGRGGADAQGREAFVDLPLPNDPKVSLRHARISWAGAGGDRAVLEDLESKSGTWVRLEGLSPAEDGDIFWLGELYLRVVRAR